MQTKEKKNWFLSCIRTFQGSYKHEGLPTSIADSENVNDSHPGRQVPAPRSRPTPLGDTLASTISLTIPLQVLALGLQVKGKQKKRRNAEERVTLGQQSPFPTSALTPLHSSPNPLPTHKGNEAFQSKAAGRARCAEGCVLGTCF